MKEDISQISACKQTKSNLKKYIRSVFIACKYMVETDIDDDYIDEICNVLLMMMMAMFVMMKLCVGTVSLNDDTYGNDDDDDIAVVIMMMTTTMMTQMMRFCLGGTVDLN